MTLINAADLSIRNVSVNASAQALALDAAGHAFILEDQAAQIVSLSSGAILKTLTGLPYEDGPIIASSNGSAFYYIVVQSVVAVDTKSGKAASIPVANVPTGNFTPASLALSADNSTLYFLDPLQGLIATIDTATLQVTGSFPVPGATQMNAGPDPRLDLFTNLPQTDIANITTGQIDSSFIGGGCGVVNSSGTLCYSYSTDSVATIDLATGIPAEFGLSGLSQFGGEPSNIALSPKGDSIFATGSDSSGVFAAQLGLPFLHTIKEYRLPPPPKSLYGSYLGVSGLTVSPDGSKLYVPVLVYANIGEGAKHGTAITGIYVFDVSSGRLTGLIPCQCPYGFASSDSFVVSPDGLTGYMLLSLNGIQLFDLTTLAPGPLYPLPDTIGSNCGGLALSPDGTRISAYCVNTTPTLSVFSTKTGLQTGLVTLTDQPFAFAFAPDGISGIIGTLSGFSLVDLTSYQVTRSVPTTGGVMGIAIIP